VVGGREASGRLAGWLWCGVVWCDVTVPVLLWIARSLSLSLAWLGVCRWTGRVEMSPPLSNAVDLLDSAPFLFAVDLAAEVDSVTEPQPVPPAKRARVENGVEQQKTQSPSPQGGSGATLSATPAPADAQASAALKGESSFLPSLPARLLVPV
jgi:hypothetical protein